METLLALLVALALLAAAGFLARRRRAPAPGPKAEDLLLGEAKVVEPIAPGMAGKVELSKAGAALPLPARAQDPAQAFERGALVRLID
jgi:hypothetical protein